MNIEEMYFEYLMYLAFHKTNCNYRELLKFLHEVPFTYTIILDKNREYDGLQLRRKFIRENDIPEENLVLINDRPCSVLEMMVGLTNRLYSDILYDWNPNSRRMEELFFDMLITSKLSEQTDDRFDREWCQFRIDCILGRDYDYDGDGGFFRVINPRRDMREVDLWYQAQWYIAQIEGGLYNGE